MSTPEDRLSISTLSSVLDVLRGRWLAIVAGAAALIAVLAVAAYFYDHARRDLIAKGVTIAGVPVGGLSEADARAKIERELSRELNKPVRIHSGSHHWTLSARRAGVTVDAANMVSQAVDASRAGLDLHAHGARPDGWQRAPRDPARGRLLARPIKELTATIRAT